MKINSDLLPIVNIHSDSTQSIYSSKYINDNCSTITSQPANGSREWVIGNSIRILIWNQEITLSGGSSWQPSGDMVYQNVNLGKWPTTFEYIPQVIVYINTTDGYAGWVGLHDGITATNAGRISIMRPTSISQSAHYKIEILAIVVKK